MKRDTIISLILLLVTGWITVQAKQSVSYRPVCWFNGQNYYTGNYYPIGNQQELFTNINGMDLVLDNATTTTIGFPVYALFCNDEGDSKTRIYRIPLFRSNWITKNDNQNTTYVDSLEIIINSGGTDTVYFVFMEKELSHWEMAANATTVMINNSLWQEVSSFASSPQNAHHYTLDRDRGILVFGGGQAAQLSSDMSIMVESYLVPEDSAGIINTNTSINGSFNSLKSLAVIPSGPGFWNQDSLDVVLADRTCYNSVSDVIRIRNADYDSGLSTLTPANSSLRYRGYIDTTEDIYFIGTKNERNILGFICDRGKKRLIVADGSQGDTGSGYDPGYGVMSFPQQTDNSTLVGGIANQTFYINTNFYPNLSTLDSITVLVDTDPWRHVASFTNQTDTSQVYTYDRFKAGLKFGNGLRGMIPAVGDDQPLSFSYYPSIDLFQYDSLYAAQHNMPILKQPRAVAARRNEMTGYIDVYIADSACIYKFYLTGNSIPSYHLQYHSTFATDCQPLDLDVILYQKYGTVSTDQAEVYIFVVDSLSGIIKVYSDEAALNPALTDAPRLVKTIGEKGNVSSINLGVLYKPRTVSVIGGEFGQDKVDVYVSDTSNTGSRIHKFQGVYNDIPQIHYISPASPQDTADLTMAPHATFRIFYSITDDNLDACRLSLYFDPDSANVNGQLSGNETLIGSDLRIDQSKNYADWNMDGSLLSYPQTGYIFAIITDEFGQTNYQYSQYKLKLSDDYKTTCALVDALDGDDRLVVNNNSRNREIAIILKNPDDITSLSIKGSVYSDQFRITSITEGPLFSQYSGGGSVFFNYLPISTVNTTGIFEINISLINSTAGISRGGIVAYLNVEIDSNQINCYSDTVDNRYFLTGLILDTINTTCQKGSTGTEPEDGMGYEHLLIIGAMVGDIATDSTYSYGTPPHLNVFPDGRIDGKDVLLFTQGWNGINGQQDPLADIAPVVYWRGSNPPYMYSKPDGQHNAADIIAFSLMYSWYASNFYPSFLSRPALDKNSENGFDYQLDFDSLSSEYIIRIRSLGRQSFMFGQAEFTLEDYDFSNLNYVPGSILSSRGADPLVLPCSQANKLSISFSRLSPSSPGITMEGDILTIRFTLPQHPPEINLSARIMMTDEKAETICNQTTRLTLNTSGQNPRSTILMLPYPNPFNHCITIPFYLDQAMPVSLQIYNLMGEKVEELIRSSRLPAGNYTWNWNPGSHIPTGTYLTHFRAGDYTKINKIIFLK